MIVYKNWTQTTRLGYRSWSMDGWFLFGFIPLFKRDLSSRGSFGKKF